MNKVELVRGEVYHIQTTDESSFPNRMQNAVYVRKEIFPKSGTEWETFYSILGGINLACSEGVVNMDGILQRIRIPANSIKDVVDGTITFDGELVTKLIQDPDNRTPLVESWLKEVEKLGYRQ